MDTLKIWIPRLLKSVMFYFVGHIFVLGFAYLAREIGPRYSQFWDTATWIIIHRGLLAVPMGILIYYFVEWAERIDGDIQYVLWAFLFYFMFLGFGLELAFPAGERLMLQSYNPLWRDVNRFAFKTIGGALNLAIAASILKWISNDNEELQKGTIVVLKIGLVIFFLVFAISLAGTAGIIHQYQEGEIVLMSQQTRGDPSCFAFIRPFESLFDFPLEVECRWQFRG